MMPSAGSVTAPAPAQDGASRFDAETRRFLTALNEGPGRIREAARRLLSTKNAHAHAERELKRRKMDLLLRVSAELSPDTNKPRYSNEAARNAAVEALLETDRDALALVARVDGLALQAQEQAADLQYERDVFAAVLALAHPLLGGDAA